MSAPTWHGLNNAQWNALWDAAGWRDVVRAALYEVAASPDASLQDRLGALDTLNIAIREGKLPADIHYPQFLRDVLLTMSAGTPPPRRFGRRRRTDEMHARLISARWALGTYGNFPPEPVEAVEVDTSRFS